MNRPSRLALPVVELRQYTLKPGRRETLIDIFDSHFIEGQEDAGMTIIGQFRDLDRPDMSLSSSTAGAGTASNSSLTILIGRILLSVIFLLSGFGKLTAIAGTAGYFGAMFR